jgi:hypothetical protein
MDELHGPGGFTPRKEAPGTHRTGSWLGRRVDTEAVKKVCFLLLTGIEPKFLGCTARSLNTGISRTQITNYKLLSSKT